MNVNVIRTEMYSFLIDMWERKMIMKKIGKEPMDTTIQKRRTLEVIKECNLPTPCLQTIQVKREEWILDVALETNIYRSKQLTKGIRI